MKVKELKEALKNIPDNAIVKIDTIYSCSEVIYNSNNNICNII